jgi:hypothetical protein
VPIFHRIPPTIIIVIEKPDDLQPPGLAQSLLAAFAEAVRNPSQGGEAPKINYFSPSQWPSVNSQIFVTLKGEHEYDIFKRVFYVVGISQCGLHLN